MKTAEKQIDPGYLEIAKELMMSILYDNGYIDRWHSEKSQFSKRWQYRIAPIAGKFFDLQPELLTDETVENICCGFVEENQESYGDLDGYKELDKILNEYFNSGCGVTSKFVIKEKS